MPQIASRDNPDTFIIVNEINDRDAATLRGDNGSTYHITSHEDNSLHDYLASHHADDHVRMDIVRTDVHVSVWWVSALYPSADE